MMQQQPRRQQQLTADLWAKAGELEKQFATYKKKIEVRSSDDHRAKDSGNRRGEFYDKYMRIRDARLREQLGGNGMRVDGKKQAEMAAMWEQLDKRQAEMAARFAGGGAGAGAGGKVGPARTPEMSATPTKKTVQLKKESPDEKKGRDVTPRSTSSTRRSTTLLQSSTSTSSQLSSITRASTLPQSPKRTQSISSSNGTKNVPRLSSPARSAAIFSDLRKESKTPVTPKTRVLTKSQSLVLEKNGGRASQKRPPQHVNVSKRGHENNDMFESKDYEQSIIEETNSGKSGNDTIFEPDITIEDDILPKLQESLTEAVLNQKIEEELLNMRSSSSNEILDFLESNNESSEKNEEDNNLKPYDVDDGYNNTVNVSNVASILNPAIDDDGESSGGSSRSWCSNVETLSFSRSTIDPMIDSPILSPRGSGSTSFRFLPEPSTVRVRKKWESRSINSPRGIKRFLSFGKKNKVSEILANDIMSTSAGLSSIITDDDEGDSFSNVINRMSSISYESNGSRTEIESETGNRPSVSAQQAPVLTGSLAASVLKYDQKEDGLTVNSQKSHRSFFAFPPFLFKGAESKIRS